MSGKVAFAHGYGEPVRVGREIGQQLAGPIREVLASLDIPARFDSEDKRAWLDKLMDNIAKEAPALVEEMDGIAQGAGVDREAIYVLNCIVELSRPACSLVGYAQAPGGPVVGKNVDLAPGEPALAVTVVELGGGRQLLRAHWPGTVWGDGVNERGLSIAAASVSTAEHRDDGIPTNMAVRLVLERAGNVDEAVEVVAELKIAAKGFNAVVADPDNALIVERSVNKMAVREPEDGVLCATNHFTNPDLAELMTATEAQLAESRDRLARLEELARAREGGREALQEILADHGPPAICRHEGAVVTVAALVLRPRARVLWFAGGRPCEAPFRPFQLKLPATAGSGILGYAT